VPDECSGQLRQFFVGLTGGFFCFALIKDEQVEINSSVGWDLVPFGGGARVAQKAGILEELDVRSGLEQQEIL
jgi:hypothetical protein